MALSDYISVQIQAGTVNPARRGFGTPFILTYHTKWADTQVRTYTSFAGVAADFSPSDMAYRAASAIFSQPIRPEKIKVGRLPAPSTGQTVVIDFTNHPTGAAIVGSVVGPTGVATPINVAWNTNIATTLTALGTALALIGPSANLIAAPASPLITVTGAAVFGRMWHYSFATAAVRETTADWGYDISLAAHADVDGDWYAVITDSNSPKNMDKIARWALANQRFAFFAPQYSQPSQFVTGEFTAGGDYTALLANDHAAALFTKSPRSTFAEAAWAGRMLPLDPGSATWAFKALVGVGADTWTASERFAISSTNRGNFYALDAQVPLTYPGKTLSGEWIDVVLGLDWLQARIAERVFALFLNNPKVPYTDVGIGLIVAEVRAQLQEAEDRKVLDKDWTVTAKAALAQAPADRAARIVRDIEFLARLSGAIHTARITGTVVS